MDVRNTFCWASPVSLILLVSTMMLISGLSHATAEQSTATGSPEVKRSQCHAISISGSKIGRALVAENDGFRTTYKIVGKGGTEFTGTVEFVARQMHAASRPDGGALFALGDLRLNSIDRKDAADPEPLKIFLDSGEIYSSDKALSVGIAHDGSSYFVVEPMADQSSRLVIRTVADGTSSVVDLGRRFESFESGEMQYGIRYTPKGDEIMIFPSEFGGASDFPYSFVPVMGGQEIARSFSELAHLGAFESSDTAYVILQEPDSESRQRIAKMAYDRAGVAKIIWSRVLPGNPIIYATPEIKDNGKWIIVNAYKPYVLDAETGAIALELPSPEEENDIRKRYAIPPNVNIGDLVDITLIEDRIVVTRRTMDHEEMQSCVATTLNPAKCEEEQRASGEMEDRIYEFAIMDGGITQKAQTFRKLETTALCNLSHEIRVVGNLAQSPTGELQFQE